MATAETIYALATAPGRGGVAVVRVSGPQGMQSLQALVGAIPEPRYAQFCTIKNPSDKSPIDAGVVIRFAAPASFTGEDVVEYHIHGGRAVTESLLAVLAKQPGHRLALPGEFTRRAFENGKMDLTEAEAVADLVHSETEEQRLQALSQLQGGLSGLYSEWCDRLARALAHLEAAIDFPEDDLPEEVAAAVNPVIHDLLSEIRSHLDDARRGERLREGIHVAVLGAPNAGKSSLVNALAQRDVAIVSEHAGTTRDIVEVHLDLDGFPVILSDTAGLRPDQIGDKGQEGIESEGIRRALRRAQEADIKVLVFDATLYPALDKHTQALVDDRALCVLNKCDVASISDQKYLNLSTKTGAGMKDFLCALSQKARGLIGTRTGPPLTRQRHRAALTECCECLERTLSAPLPELAAEDVRLSIRAIGRITGRVDVEDILDIVFRDFCIGK